MTETAPHFRFCFQHCRAGVRTLSDAGMGLSETPELIATRDFVILPAILTSTGLGPELLSRLLLHLAAPVALGFLRLLARLAVAARLGS